MSDFYVHGSYPSTGVAATSAAMRAELDLITAAFNKLPTLAGNGNKVVVVNSGGTALDAVDTLAALGVTDSGFLIADNLDTSKKIQFQAASITSGATRVLTAPDGDGTIALLTLAQTLTNKSIDLASNTFTGTLAQFNSACSNADFVSLAGSESLSNKTLTSSAFNGTVGATTPSTGAFTTVTATGNITAYYSDDRLKTRLGPIENALDKICAIETFYYEANATAQELGYEPVREVGVSAQSVQRVFPEVVHPAPIGGGYLTVDYERLVPGLIEAVKVIRAELKALKGK